MSALRGHVREFLIQPGATMFGMALSESFILIFCKDDQTELIVSQERGILERLAMRFKYFAFK